MTRLCAIAAALAAAALAYPAAARADAEEASIRVSAAGGLARLEDPAAGEARTAPLGGLGVAWTVASHNLFAYEIEAAGAGTGDVRYPDYGAPEDEETLLRRTRLGRVSVGVTGRFGARYIPVVGANLGAQIRNRSVGRVAVPSGDGPDDGETTIDRIGGDTLFELSLAAFAGFEYRIDKHWILGARVTGRLATGSPAFSSLGGSLDLAYYWYPRWF